LGHTMGLGHDDNTAPFQNAYKPNFLSVMNYYYNLDGLRRDGKDYFYDYARFNGIPHLDEGDLDENIGIDGGPQTLRYGIRHQSGAGTHIDQPGTGPMDWNCNNDKTETHVATDIDPFHGDTFDQLGPQPTNEWRRLDITFVKNARVRGIGLEHADDPVGD